MSYDAAAPVRPVVRCRRARDHPRRSCLTQAGVGLTSELGLSWYGHRPSLDGELGVLVEASGPPHGIYDILQDAEALGRAGIAITSSRRRWAAER